MKANIGIKGIQEVEAALLRAIAAVEGHGGLGQAVTWATSQLHRYATYLTHVVSGALRASHRMAFAFDKATARGQIYIDEGSVNPLGQKPAEYGPAEHKRGGSHAFYQRTYDEQGGPVAGRAIQFIEGKM